MNDPRECYNKAEALATLALMFPDNADRYRAKELHWRNLEAEARRKAHAAGLKPDGGAAALSGPSKVDP